MRDSPGVGFAASRTGSGRDASAPPSHAHSAVIRSTATTRVYPFLRQWTHYPPASEVSRVMAENCSLISNNMYPQKESLKDASELSKNLVSGDFERQYRNVLEKGGRRRHCCLLVGLTLTVLAGCLLVLTVVREVQISRLRSEVDQLSANMIAMTESIKSLHNKVSNNKLYNDFKNFEETIYTDDDGVTADGKVSDKDKDSVEGLQGLTILEDEGIDMEGDDEYDDDDGESGDYFDYDKNEKIGTTNMVQLKPEDFTDAVIKFPNEKHTLSELKRLINADPENPGIAETLKTTPTTTKRTEEKRSKRSMIAESNAEFVAPRSFAKDEVRKVKKYASSMESGLAQKMALHSVTRTARNSEDERRPFIAAHFHGNTSHLHPGVHGNYKGNGLLRVSHGSAHNVWYPAAWTIASPHPRPTLNKNGHIHVHHTGVYLVYAQIYYLDSHDVISWVLHRTNPDTEGQDTLLQCAQSAHSSEPFDKPNSCFSASALFLRAGDRLAVRNTSGDRHSLMEPEKSFIGLVKLADASEPSDEM